MHKLSPPTPLNNSLILLTPPSLSNSNYMYSLVPLHQLTPLSLSHHSLSFSLSSYSFPSSTHTTFSSYPFTKSYLTFILYSPYYINPLTLTTLFQPLSLLSQPTFSHSHHSFNQLFLIFQPTFSHSHHTLSTNSPYYFN